jgi:hypothetical protein
MILAGHAQNNNESFMVGVAVVRDCLALLLTSVCVMVAFVSLVHLTVPSEWQMN